MKRLSTTLFTVTLLLLPIAVAIEHQNLSIWQNRLVIPKLEEEPNRHTPKHFAGTFLPPVIKTNTTLSASDNPIILPSKTLIQPGVTLTLSPGTQLYANENTSLLITGRLIAKGSRNAPIKFSSNEKHPLNQTWLGLSVAAEGTAVLENIIIEDASPAISCLENSRVVIANTQIIRGTLGVFQTSKNCKLSNSLINGVQNGIIAINTKPQTTNTIIISKKNDIITTSLP